MAESLLAALAAWAVLRFAPSTEGEQTDDVEDAGELFAADER